ncbi:YqeG family HAD IIIA-type phosphatase [Candidatus Woesearchaeota archaeon]|nr:YqeG family HAD IIIA-type phosphatase [Candidatus Woesearchaeota archaeon]
MQSFNPQGLIFFPYAFFNRRLLIPNEAVKSINEIEFDALKRRGFKAVLFDKDNTLTEPYQKRLSPLLKKGFAACKKTFTSSIAIFSNHAGTGDDNNHETARAIERALGIAVIRHRKKKPAGMDEVSAFFNCQPEEIIVIGDRLFTDIAFGNRYGCHTILVNPLTKRYENALSAWVAGWERKLLKK